MTDSEIIQVPIAETGPALTIVVCGVDGSAEAAEAARQAALLAEPGARLELVGVIHTGLVESVASVMPAHTEEPERRLRKDAWAAIDRVAHEVPAGIDLSTTLRAGPAAALIAGEAERLQADTIVVGSHGQGRLAGALLGSVATRLVHDAPCSVLIARPAPAATFPRAVVVGVDESEASLKALAVGRELSRRTGADLRAVHVRYGEPLPERMAALGAQVVSQAVTPAAALAERATAEDLLVVGSRRKRGLRSVGSVSEAVAHRAVGSVLIVR
jgi:nucleotide-binding universal stress UspA family protein